MGQNKPKSVQHSVKKATRKETGAAKGVSKNSSKVRFSFWTGLNLGKIGLSELDFEEA